MPASQLGPRLLWRILATANAPFNRTVVYGKNPLEVPQFYTRAIFHLRAVAENDLDGIVGLQIFCFGALSPNGFPALGAGVFSNAVFWSLMSFISVSLTQGVIRQGKAIDNATVPVTQQRTRILPKLLLLEWRTNVFSDPGATKTMEVWGSFIGPETQASQ